MSEIKYMGIKEFREIGFLQEANRQFFHPHGLALEVTTVEEGGWSAKSWQVQRVVAALLKTLHQAPASAEACTALAIDICNALWPIGSEHISNVWDERDDPEGIYFDWPQWEPQWFVEDGSPREKALRVSNERTRRYETRRKLFEKIYGRALGTHEDVEPYLWRQEGP